MTEIVVTDRASARRKVSTNGAATLMEAIRDAGIDDMLALCGGCCSCSTCHVYIQPAFVDRLPPSEEPEDDLLSELKWRQPNSRLAFQVELSDACEGLCVTIAPEN